MDGVVGVCQVDDHVFIDFTKTFGRVWHAALWAAMKKYNSTYPSHQKPL